jgi:hypothetical protein
MHRSSLVHRPLSLLLALAWLALPQLGGTARAADKFSKVTFDTADGVTLQGTFYPSAKGKDEPTVLLLHKIGSDSHKDGWDSLAGALNDKGYSVLSFDFRGHGNSTTVDPMKFWTQSWNKNNIRGGAYEKGGIKLKDAINREAFVPAYYPYLVNDIAAAKWFLDDRNDAGDCNSRALLVIGAEDGATLGALWMFSEWNRYPAAQVIFNPRGPQFGTLSIRGIEKDPEGKDQYASLWLSITTRLGNEKGSISVNQAVKSAVRFMGKEKKQPMGFLFGEKDELGAKHADEFYTAIKGSTPAAEDKLVFTAKKAIKDSKLTGSALLRKDLGTQESILSYLEKLREKNVPQKWRKVDADRTAYVWNFPGRTPLGAKEEKGKVLEPIPVGLLGLNNP